MTPTPTPHYPRTRTLPGEDYPAHLVAIYEFMEKYIKERHYPPTNREMVDNNFASSTSVIRFYYGYMKRLGMIDVTPNVARGIYLIPRKEWKKHATTQPVPVNMEIHHANAQ